MTLETPLSAVSEPQDDASEVSPQDQAIRASILQARQFSLCRQELQAQLEELQAAEMMAEAKLFRELAERDGLTVTLALEAAWFLYRRAESPSSMMAGKEAVWRGLGGEGPFARLAPRWPFDGSLLAAPAEERAFRRFAVWCREIADAIQEAGEMERR